LAATHAVNIFFADADLVNGKREVVTTYVNADGIIDWAVTGETTMFPTMGRMVSATMT
jgi:hypothetical protein